MAGQETYYSESINLDNTYSGFGQSNFGLTMLPWGYPVNEASGKSRFGLVSVFGRMMYSYADHFLITATLRGDGVSKFAPPINGVSCPPVGGMAFLKRIS